MPKVDTWDSVLRKQIKLEHGRGWSISPQSGKAKLTRRYSDGTRSSVTLAIPWAASSGSAINAAIAKLRLVMEERAIGLKEAYLLVSAGRLFATWWRPISVAGDGSTRDAELAGEGAATHAGALQFSAVERSGTAGTAAGRSQR